MTPDEWRERVGQHIERRRLELRLSIRKAAQLAGFSDAQWRQMESGRRGVATQQFVTVNPRAGTRSAACSALGWSPSSIELLLAGESPVELDDASNAGTQHQIDQLVSDLAQLRQDHLELAASVQRLSGGLGRAAESGQGLPPAVVTGTVSRPHPAAEAD